MESINEQKLEQVTGGVEVKYGKKVDQYDVKISHAYAIYFPMQDGPLIIYPYGNRSGHTYRIMVYRVYEAPGVLFGTNRTVDGIDMDNFEYVTVEINHGNVYELN